MAQVMFYEKDHKYEVNGEEKACVSEISRFASREVYGNVNQYALDNAAKRGSAVHRATEALDKYGECEVATDIENYVRAYVRFKKEFHVGDYVWIEKSLYSATYDFTGTLDRVLTVDEAFAAAVREKCGIELAVGSSVIIDLKTSSAVQKVLAQIQLNGYWHLAHENGCENIAGLFILHLSGDGTYKLLPFEVDDTLFMSCLNLHNAFRKKKRKTKKETNNNE